MRSIIKFAAVAGAMAIAAPVAAASLVTGSGTFTADIATTGHSAPNATFSFSFRLPTPLPADGSPGGDYEILGVSNYSFTLNGIDVADPVEQIIFYPIAKFGLFDLLFAVDAFSVFGADVGSTGTLLYGSFPATFGIDGANEGFGSGTVTITAVPEPATWALMIGGFGLAGVSLRRRRLALAE